MRGELKGIEILNIYEVLLIISLIMIVALAVIGQKQNITQYILLFAAIMISIFGDYVISVSDTLNMAIMGQNMVYLGGVFTPILILFSTMKMCRIKIPKTLWITLVTLAATVLLFVFNVKNSDIYYKSLEIGKANGMNHNGKFLPLEKHGEFTSLFLKDRYGKSKRCRWIKGRVIVPVSYVQHIYPKFKRRDVNKYIPKYTDNENCISCCLRMVCYGLRWTRNDDWIFRNDCIQF